MLESIKTLFKKEKQKSTIKIAVTGHVDHGKSTLIGQLMLQTGSLPEDRAAELKKISKEFGKDTELAYLADQLKEERENNITIDTTEIFLTTSKNDIVLIDTPGHLEFIQNMLTGASRADAAILIIDAAEGIQDQTRRHGFLLKLLHLQPIIVAVNKMDKLNYNQDQFSQLETSVRDWLTELGLMISDVIPLSAQKGDNITQASPQLIWYKGPSLLKAIDRIASQETQLAKQPASLCVQDAYPDDENSISVGRLSTGQLQPGQTVTILPSGQRDGISILKGLPENQTTAQPYDNLGLRFKNHKELSRGHVICSADSDLRAVTELTGHIFVVDDKEISTDETLTFRCATQDVSAKMTQINERIDPRELKIVENNASVLKPHDAAIVNITLDKPTVAAPFSIHAELGRFILERNGRMIAAGIVKEIHNINKDKC